MCTERKLDIGIAAMPHDFRLSRLRAPRANWASIALLTVVLLFMGAVAGLARSEAPRHDRPVVEQPAMFVNWMLAGLLDGVRP
jgi:hypothetical protein